MTSLAYTIDFVPKRRWFPLIFLYLGYEFDKRFWAARLLSFTDLNRDRRVKFITIFFNTYGHISMVDGHSSDIERNVALNLMQVLQLNDLEKKLASNAYIAGQSKAFKLSYELHEFKKTFKFNKVIREYFIRLQIDGMIASDDETTQVLNSLYAITSQVNVSSKLFKIYDIDTDINYINDIKNFYRKPYVEVKLNQKKKEKQKNRFEQDKQGKWYNVNSELNKAYKILGVSPGDDNADIVRAYRLLMSKYHPDKTINKDSTVTERDIAQNQTIKIRQAYESIKKERNIK